MVGLAEQERLALMNSAGRVAVAAVLKIVALVEQAVLAEHQAEAVEAVEAAQLSVVLAELEQKAKSEYGVGKIITEY